MEIENFKQTERRIKPRINCAYPAKVSGQDSSGRLFDESTTIDNISSSGLHVLLKKEIQPKAGLAVIFRFSKTSPLGKGTGPLIAVEGNVVRIQKQMDGTYSVAIKIQNHRFL